MSTPTPAMTSSTGSIDPVTADLSQVLRALKLSGLKDTLPERLALARTRKMGHAAFMELLLSDEVSRRDSRSAKLRARTAGLDPTMVLDTWTEPDDLRYDRMLLSDLTSLAFVDANHGALILGPVGVVFLHPRARSSVPAPLHHQGPSAHRGPRWPVFFVSGRLPGVVRSR